jgi:glycerophosphoryl diester phosphodiesterase
MGQERGEQFLRLTLMVGAVRFDQGDGSAEGRSVAVTNALHVVFDAELRFHVVVIRPIRAVNRDRFPSREHNDYMGIGPIVSDIMRCMSLAWSLDIFRGTVRDLQQSLWPLIRLDVYFKLLSLIVLAPATSWLANILVSRSGRLNFANDEILGFLASPPGIVWVFVAGTLAAALGFFEAGGVQIIVQQRGEGVRRGPGSILVEILRRAKDLLALGARVVGAHLLVTAPFVVAVAATYRWLLMDYEINYLVHETPPVWWAAVSVACVLGAGAIVANLVVYLGWVTALPVMLFESESAAGALRRSWSLVRGGLMNVMTTAALATGFAVFLPAAAAFVIHTAGRGVFSVLSGSPRAVVIFVVVLLLVEGVALVAAAFVGTMITTLTQARLWRVLAMPGDIESVAETQSSLERRVPTVAVWLVLVVGLIAATIITSRAISLLRVPDRIEITAHRGSSESAPENTLPAIRQAIEDGAHWAEIDVRETSDGEIIVIHDEDFMRIAGDGRKIWDMSLEDVREFDVGGWFDSAFAGERVPTLEEAIATARGKIGLNIELKFRENERSLAAGVVRILKGTDFVGQSVVTSLNLVGLAHVEEIDSSVRTGAIIFGKLGQLSDLRWDVLAISARLATRDAIVSAQRSGKEVHVWTVNDPRQMSHFINLGVDNILTDRPRQLADLLADRAELTDEERLLLRLGTWLGW